MRHLYIGVGGTWVIIAILSVYVWYHRMELLVSPAHCASCPDWPCVTATSCGGSVSSGCLCLTSGHEQLGICVSKTYFDSVRARSSVE
jgi:hypothetical protein